MIFNEKGSINLQSALNHLVDMGKENPSILMEYAQNPPASLGSNGSLLVNMAANIVGDQRQRAQAAQQQGQQPTVMEQGIAKLAPQQPQMPPQMMAQAPQMPPQMQEAPVQMAGGGLADLELDNNMFNEESYATGGIVAFEDGGEVGMNVDNLPSLNVNTGTQSAGGLGGSMNLQDLYTFNNPMGEFFMTKILGQMPASERAKFLNSGMGGFFGIGQVPTKDYYTSSGELVKRAQGMAQGGEVGMNVDNLPSLNVNTGEQQSIQERPRFYNRDIEEYLKMAIPGFGRDNEPRYTNAMTAMYDLITPGLMGGKQESDSRPANSMNAMYDHIIKKSQGMAQGGEVKHYDGLSGSYVEGQDYPDYTTEEEPTSPFGRLVDYLDFSGNIKKSDFGKRRERRKQLDEEIQKTVPTLIGGERGWFDKESKAKQKEYEDKRKALQEEKKKYPFFEPTAPVVAPTVDVKADKIKEEPKPSSENKISQIKKLTDENRMATNKVEEEQLASYDQALQRVMDAAKDDPYRKELRKQYQTEKDNAFYDVLGDIGTALVGAKKGQEGEALQKGFTAANARLKDLRKQQKDLTLAEQKADQEYKMLGIKYGFDSEQARAALQAKYKIQAMNDATEVKKYSILAGSKEGNLDFKAIDAVNKGVAKFLSSNPLIAMNYNKDPASAKTDAERQRIIDAKKAVANEEARLQNSFAQFLGVQTGSKEDDDLISKYLKIK